MQTIKMLARLLLAGVFISGGSSSFSNPDGRAKKVHDAGVPNAREMVVFNGGAMVVGGVALAFGILPRLAATGLVASLIPTTLVGHAFWKEEDPAARHNQQTQFLKNLGLIGGLLLVIADKDADE